MHLFYKDDNDNNQEYIKELEQATLSSSSIKIGKQLDTTAAEMHIFYKDDNDNNRKYMEKFE